ncbi:MAG TPA: GGDEF domain-containing protein [Pseudonocardiaceae bacterium]|nr:GGDEF domain-containing protein [Pseudonocardiaceae bacterium]
MAAVGVTITLSIGHPITTRSLTTFGIVVALGLMAAEAARGVERMRRWFANTPHVNMSSVWTLAAALLVSPALVAATIGILYLHLWVRSWYRVSGVHAFRVLFNVGVVVLSCQAVSVLARYMPDFTLDPTTAFDLLDILVVIFAYAVVNSTLAAIALLLLRDGRSPREVLGSWHENSLEFATLCVGVLTAGLLVSRPLLTLLVLLPLHTLHRSVLIRQLENAATTDERTGLLNATTWHSLATAQLERTRLHGKTVGLLLVDIDRLAHVNDMLGRAEGDQALQAVGTAIRHTTRPGDLGGRLAGEEFAILLADCGLAEAVELAERLCEFVRTVQLGGTDGQVVLTVSIGVAAYPDAGPNLDAVLLAADNALFAAKDAGRDRVSAARLGIGRPDTLRHPGEVTPAEAGLRDH